MENPKFLRATVKNMGWPGYEATIHVPHLVCHKLMYHDPDGAKPRPFTKYIGDLLTLLSPLLCPSHMPTHNEGKNESLEKVHINRKGIILLLGLHTARGYDTV